MNGTMKIEASRDGKTFVEVATNAQERRAGQRWKCVIEDTGTVVGTLLDLSNGHWSVKRDDGTSDVWIDLRWKMKGFTMTLIADAPSPAASREAPACKAPEWCGVELDVGDTRGQVYVTWHRENHCPPTVIRVGAYRYCSPACRAARVPPLAATPVTTGAKHASNCADYGGYACSCGAVKALTNDLGTAHVCGYRMANGHQCQLNSGHQGACSMWRAEKAPPAQEAPKALPCLGCRKAICIGEYLLCSPTGAQLRKREPLGKTTLINSKLPDRIDRRLRYQPFDDSFCAEAGT